MAVSFDLFGTLVDVDAPADPAAAVASELAARDVAVPDDWGDTYARVHVDVPDGAETPLSEHVTAALSSRGPAVDPDPDPDVVRRAVVAAFDPVVDRREGARAALEAARERGPVAICSNCSVREVVPRALERAVLEPDRFDAIVTSVGCGWRKPGPEIFRETADRLGVDPWDLVHVGDDPRTDGGIERLGGTAIVLEGERERTLADVPALLEAIDRW